MVTDRRIPSPPGGRRPRAQAGRTVDDSGKRALFSASPGADPGPPSPGAGGKEALFSAGRKTPGTVLVECESCRRRTRLDYLELARAHLPVWLWLPWRRHSHLIVCPACRRRGWMRVDWFS